jgi:hypothetical protein
VAAEHAWQLVLAALGGLAVLGSSGILVWASRRDHLAEQLRELGERVAHVEGYLDRNTDFLPRAK